MAGGQGGEPAAAVSLGVASAGQNCCNTGGFAAQRAMSAECSSCQFCTPAKKGQRTSGYSPRARPAAL